MSNKKNHSHGKGQHGHGSQSQGNKKIHHDWRFWVSIAAVVLMLMSMIIYVISDDEALPVDRDMPAMPAAE